jgi:hypothetical protein
VRYSRIDPNKPDDDDPDERVAPMFVGVEVPEIRESDSRKSRVAPEVRPPADGNGRARRRSPFGLFFAFAILAFLTGIGVLAGSFYYLTVAKVKRPVVASEAKAPDIAFLPVSGAAQTLSGGADKPETPAKTAASIGAGQPEANVAPDFSAANEPDSRLVVSVEPAVNSSAEMSRAEAPAKAPLPRTRPEKAEESASQPTASVTVKRNSEPKLRPLKSEQKADVARVEPAPAEAPPVEDPLALPGAQADGRPADQAANDPLLIDPNSGEKVPIPPADIPEQPAAAAAPQQQVIISAAPADGSLEEQQPAVVPAPGDGQAEAVPDAVPGPSGDATSDGADPYQSALDNWRVLSVRDGVAVIDGRERGVFMVQRGSEIPGVGIVEAIKKRHGRWTVVTSVGFILSAAVDVGGGWRPLRFLERRRFLTR